MYSFNVRLADPEVSPQKTKVEISIIKRHLRSFVVSNATLFIFNLLLNSHYNAIVPMIRIRKGESFYMKNDDNGTKGGKQGHVMVHDNGYTKVKWR